MANVVDDYRSSERKVEIQLHKSSIRPDLPEGKITLLEGLISEISE